MILIVDDDPSVTASLALLLKQNGYATRSASLRHVFLAPSAACAAKYAASTAASSF